SEGSDGIVKLWDARTKRVRAVLPKLGDQVFCVAFSPDGRFLATGGSDRTARLWDLATKRPVATFNGYPGDGRWALAFSPDGKTLAMGYIEKMTARPRDNRVKLWDVRSHRELAVIRTHVQG